MKARGRVLAGSTLGVLLTLAAVCGVPSPLHAMHTDSLASGTLAPAAESRRETAVGPVHIGGYVEAGGRWQRSDGITEELGLELKRFNLMTTTELRRRIRVSGEIELEDGGEEIVLELAQVDVLLHPSASLRAGILLLPLGRFNLSHDGPGNDLPSRPAMATDLLGSALSQPGLGVYGQLDAPLAGRLGYEAYAVTGYDEGILLGGSGGTRLTEGRLNREDTNASPAGVGRLEWIPSRGHTLGLSGYVGSYNQYRGDGITFDEARQVRIAVADLGTCIASFRLSGELAIVDVEIPASLSGIYASRQGGTYVQLSRFLGGDGPAGTADHGFTAALRVDAVDLDRDLRGDSARSVTFGIDWRPIPESGVKLSFSRGEQRDRFNNLSASATLEFMLTSWF